MNQQGIRESRRGGGAECPLGVLAFVLPCLLQVRLSPCLRFRCLVGACPVAPGLFKSLPRKPLIPPRRRVFEPSSHQTCPPGFLAN
jgi:hypothetical protein